MRISCKNCGAIYLIAEKIIGDKGRIVKCAKCSHSWNVEPLVVPEEVIQNQFFIKTKHLRIVLTLLIALNILAFIILFSDLLMQSSYLQPAYDKLSIHNTKNIVLEEFKVEKHEGNLIISGKLNNLSNQDRKFPSIRYTILDKNNNILTRLTTSSNERIIKAQDSVNISSKISKIDLSSHYLQIDIGNRLELLLR